MRPPALAREQRELIAGLLLGDGFVGGSGPNKHFQLSTRWRPFARWVFDELGWLSMKIVREDMDTDNRPPPAQRYIVRTHAHPDLSAFRAWYPATSDDDASGDEHADGRGRGRGVRRFPTPEDLPGGRLTARIGRAWHASAGGLAWSNPEYATTRQAWFSARDDGRAERVSTLLESVGLEPTRVGTRVQLPPKQTTAWLEWVGDPAPGVTHKWAVDVEEYRDAKRDEEGLRAWLWYNPTEDRLA